MAINYTAAQLLDNAISSLSLTFSTAERLVAEAILQQDIDNNEDMSLALLKLVPVRTEMVSQNNGEPLTGTALLNAASTLNTDVVKVTEEQNQPLTFTLSAASDSVNEGETNTFTVTASEAVTEDTVVTFTVVTDGYDATDADFQAPQLTQTATILAGETSVSFNVNPPQDGVNEDTESFGVSVDVAGSTLTADSSILDIDSKEFVLTTGRDVEAANIFWASQTQFNVDGQGPTLQSNDILTGFADRADNKLVVTDLSPGATNSNLPTGLQLNNIQEVKLNSTGNTAASGFSTVPHASVMTLDANTDGAAGIDLYLANNANTGTETTVDVTQTAYAGAAGVMVAGGHDVTVAANGGNGVMVGNQTLTNGPSVGTSVPTDAQVVTGDVDITLGNTAGGGINVYGGENVTATITSSSNTGAVDIGNTGNNTANVTAGALANATGDITLNTKGTGATVIFGGQNVTVKNTSLAGASSITIGDVTNTVASNLATGDIVIDREASIAFNGLDGSSNNDSTEGVFTVVGGENVTITTNAANQVTVGDSGTVETALNPTGDITVTNTGVVTAAGHSSAMQGAVQIAGGQNVTVETTGAAVTIGGSIGGNEETRNPEGTVEVTQTMNSAGFDRDIVVDGGTDVTVNAMGQGVTIGGQASGSPAGAIVVNQSDVFTGNALTYVNGTSEGDITANGGTTVDINTTGGNVTVGAVLGGESRIASDAVTVNNTFSGISTDSVSVLSGSTVDITTVATSGAVSVGDNTADDLNTTGDALANPERAATGDVTIVNATYVDGDVEQYGTGATNVYTNGSETVDITGGAVATVKDIQSEPLTSGPNAGEAAGTSMLSTVLLDGVNTGGAVTLTSNALENLTVTNDSNGSNNYTIENATVGHALSLTLGGNSAATTITDADAGAITVNTTDSDSTGVTQLDTEEATSLTVDNSADVRLNVANMAELTEIVLSGAGDVLLSNVDQITGAAGNLNSINAADSEGAVTLSVTIDQSTAANATAQTFTGGSGVTTLTVDQAIGNWGDEVEINGGTSGENIIVADYAGGDAGASLINDPKLSNFEILQLGSSADANTYTMTGFDELRVGAIAGSATVDGAAGNAVLTLIDDFGADNRGVSLEGTTNTTNNSLTLNLDHQGTNEGINGGDVDFSAAAWTANDDIGGGGIVAHGYESITVNSVGNNDNTMGIESNVTIPTDATLPVANRELTIKGDQDLGFASSFGTFDDTDATANGHVGFATINASAHTGGTIDVTNVALDQAGADFTGGESTLIAEGSSGSDGNQIAQVTFGGTFDTNYSITIQTTDSTAEDVTLTYTGGLTTATEAAAQIASILNGGAGANIAATGTDNLTYADFSATADEGRLIIEANTGIDFTVTAAAGGANGTASVAGTTSAIAAEEVINTVESGSGGIDYTVADGGSFINGDAYGSGREYIDLAASTDVQDIIRLTDGDVASGSNRGIEDFVTGSQSASDQLVFEDNTKTVLANVNSATLVSDLTGLTIDAVGGQSATDVATALGTDITQLQYTVSNGVIEFSISGAGELSDKNFGDLRTAAQIIVNDAAADTVATYSFKGQTYVVASGATRDVVRDTSIVQLRDNDASNGFGVEFGENTIVLDAVTHQTNGTLDQDATDFFAGTDTAESFDYTGFAEANYDVVAAAAASNKVATFDNLAASAVLNVNASGGNVHAGQIVTNQVGSAGLNSLTVNLATANATTINRLSTNDAGLVVIDNLTAVGTITRLTDITNTMNTLRIEDGAALEIGRIDSTELSTIDASAYDGDLTLGSTAQRITQNDLSIEVGDGDNNIFTSGTNVEIEVGDGNTNTINATGGSNTITTGAGNTNDITANGSNNTFNLGEDGTSFGNTVTATGADVTFNIASMTGGTNTITVGTNATVNIGTEGETHSGTNNIIVGGAETGGDSSDFARTVINFNDAVGTTYIDFDGAGTGANAFTNVAAADFHHIGQVNVATATSLEEALDMAANYEMLTNEQATASGFNNAGTADNNGNGELPAAGALSWFQYEGDTYLVGMVNDGTNEQTSLDANDVVVELTGLYTVGNQASGVSNTDVAIS